MSPNEFQLRAALREGEGAVPDADLVIARALRRRYERRRTIASIASAAAVVAVVAVGGTLLARTGSDESAGSAGGAVAGVQATHGGNPQPSAGAPLTRAPQSAHSNATAAAHIMCPAQLPHLMVPGGGGTDQFGADGPLFGEPVVTMKICTYGSTSALAEQSVLDPSAAADVLIQLNSGSATMRPGCPTASGEGGLAVYGVTGSGQALPVVTVELGCPWQATNGTAVRYLPATAVDALRPHLAPSPNHGSPLK